MNDNRTAIRELMERLDQRDVDGVLSYCAPGCAWHGFAPEPLDNEGYRVAIATFLDAYGDSRFPLDALVAEGDKVVAQHRLVGTHTGEFQGVAATGKAVSVPAIAVFRLAGGKVAQVWLHADLVGMLMQIGAIPAPPGA